MRLNDNISAYHRGGLNRGHLKSLWIYVCVPEIRSLSEPLSSRPPSKGRLGTSASLVLWATQITIYMYMYMYMYMYVYVHIYIYIYITILQIPAEPTQRLQHLQGVSCRFCVYSCLFDPLSILQPICEVFSCCEHGNNGIYIYIYILAFEAKCMSLRHKKSPQLACVMLVINEVVRILCEP